MSESGMPQLNTEYFASQIFWLVISFIILYIVMAKYALPKIANVIETREDIIARDIEEAENFKKESEITEQGYLQSIKHSMTTFKLLRNESESHPFPFEEFFPVSSDVIKATRKVVTLMSFPCCRWVH